MGRSKKSTAFLKECMADALLLLMQKKPFDKISIQEIAEKAGVGRATWFRHFSSKSDAVTFKLVCLWEQWCETHQLQARSQYTLDNALDFFSFNYSIRALYRQLYDADLQPAIYNAFSQIMAPQRPEDALECYRNRFYSYGLFGMMDEWIRRDYQETPKEMVAIVTRMLL